VVLSGTRPARETAQSVVSEWDPFWIWDLELDLELELELEL
jgi:hypothetical protein